MAFSYDEPIRYNEGKVDWTLLPWDEDLLERLSQSFNYVEEADRDRLLLSVLNNDIYSILCYSIFLLSSFKQNPNMVSNLPWDALEQVCRVFQYGTIKYQRDNYKIAPGLPLESYIQSIWRHTVSYLKGDLLDEDSKLPNLAHIACNCFMYLWTEKEYHSKG